MIRTYTELIQMSTFQERFEYLKLQGNIGAETFGFDRFINQNFYRSKEWQRIRNSIIVRDNYCDLAIRECQLFDRIIIHHMNPLTISDIEDSSELLMNQNFLISVSLKTHNAIHFGKATPNPFPVERFQGDTLLW